jgi:hypothetical protein
VRRPRRRHAPRSNAAAAPATRRARNAPKFSRISASRALSPHRLSITHRHRLYNPQAPTGAPSPRRTCSSLPRSRSSSRSSRPTSAASSPGPTSPSSPP